MTKKKPETAVVVKPKKILQNWTPEETKLIKNTVAKDATDEQLKLFLYQANRTGLDPLAKQIHCVLRKNNKTGKQDMAIQISIDGFRLIADRTGNYAGCDDTVFEGVGKVQGKDHPLKATVTIYKLVQGIRCAFTATARWDEYYPGDYLGFMWKKMAYVMLSKCCEALALRKAFPAELSGLYSDDEMHQADKKPEVIKEIEEVIEPEVEEEEVAEDCVNNAPDETQTRPCAVCGKEVEVGDEHDFDGECLCDEHWKEKHETPEPENSLDTMIKPKTKVTYNGTMIETNGVNAKQLGIMSEYYDENESQEKQVKHFLADKGVERLSLLTHEQAEAFIDLVNKPANKNHKIETARKEFWANAGKIIGKEKVESGLKKIFYELFGIQSMTKMTLEQWTSATGQLKRVIENGTQQDFIRLARERS